MGTPEKIIQIGKCRVSIFRNLIQKDGKEYEMPKAKIEIRYKDKRSHQWLGTSCMTLHEIPKAILALQQAYAYLMNKTSN